MSEQKEVQSDGTSAILFFISTYSMNKSFILLMKGRVNYTGYLASIATMGLNSWFRIQLSGSINFFSYSGSCSSC